MMKRTLIATGVAAGLLALPGLSVAQVAASWKTPRPT